MVPDFTDLYCVHPGNGSGLSLAYIPRGASTGQHDWIWGVISPRKTAALPCKMSISSRQKSTSVSGDERQLPERLAFAVSVHSGGVRTVHESKNNRLIVVKPLTEPNVLYRSAVLLQTAGNAIKNTRKYCKRFLPRARIYLYQGCYFCSSLLVRPYLPLSCPGSAVGSLCVCSELGLVGWLEFNVLFQHKYGYSRDERSGVESYPYQMKEGYPYINLNPGRLFVQ